MYTNVPTLFNSNWIDNFFDDFNSIMKSPAFSFEDSFPPLNISIQTDDEACVFELALTGYKKEWLNVEIDGLKLSIEAKIPEETEDDTKKYVKRRIKAVDFKKVYKLPEGYDTEKADVTYEDGLLSIIIPKAEEKKTVKKIQIR